jgi:hypothetical protein
MNVEKMRQMSDEELIKLYKSFWDAVYRVECYGVYDYVAMKLIEDELNKRGYVVETVEKPVVRKRRKTKAYELVIKKQ